MNNTAATVEASLKSLAQSLVKLQSEAADLGKYYFASGASDAITALASASTPATQSSGLSKNQFLNGITLAQQLVNFFGNAAVTQLDYLGSAENLIGGNFVASAPISADVEAIGARLKLLGQNVIAYYKQANEIYSLWTSSELSSASGALSSSTIVFGCSTPKTMFDLGIGIVSQYLNMMNNVAVVAGYYGANSAKWTQV